MSNEWMSDFRRFLEEYRDIWNRMDAEGMVALHHPEFQARWGYADGRVADWGYEGAVAGWPQAFQRYEGQAVKWHFEDAAVAPAGENEAMAAYWVTFEQDGALTEVRNFFVETFRREDGRWRKIREHVEANLPR